MYSTNAWTNYLDKQYNDREYRTSKGGGVKEYRSEKNSLYSSPRFEAQRSSDRSEAIPEYSIYLFIYDVKTIKYLFHIQSRH